MYQLKQKKYGVGIRAVSICNNRAKGGKCSHETARTRCGHLPLVLLLLIGVIVPHDGGDGVQIARQRHAKIPGFE